MFFGLIQQATAIVLVAPVRPVLKAGSRSFAQTRVRYGYRRVHFFAAPGGLGD